MSKSARYRILWGAVLLLALFVRVGAAFVWQSRLPDDAAFAFPDSESYWQLAASIAHGKEYEFAGARAFRPPGYPLAIAPLFLIWDQPPVMVARMMGVVLGTVVVGGVGCLTWKLFDERAGLIAASLCALYPGAIAMSILVLSEALFCPLMLLHLMCWLAASRAESAKRRLLWAAVAGISSAVATLTRPSWLLFTPMALVVAISLFPQRRQQMQIGIAMLAATVLTMSPWWIRNWIVLDAFVPTTTQVGASLYDGMHPHATGASDMRFVSEVTQDFRNSNPWTEQATSVEFEVALNRHFTLAAAKFARENPSAVARLAVVKFFRMWNIWPNEASLRSWPVRLVVAIGYVPILIASLLGAWRFARRGWLYAMCLVPAGYFTLLHVVFVGSIRYRQPPMLLLIVLAAGWISATLLQPRSPSMNE